MKMISRGDVISAVKQSGLIPVFFNKDRDTAIKIIEACAAGGAEVIEFVNRDSGAVDIFSFLIDHIGRMERPLIAGAGTVMDAVTAVDFINRGAMFIVSPFFDADIASACNSRKIPYLPGCATATEIHSAHKAGAEICKLFPAAQLGGPSFLKALRAPMPRIEAMPTGGVDATRESIFAWLEAGAVCVGMGSNLIPQSPSSPGDFEGITLKVKQVLSYIREFRAR